MRRAPALAAVALAVSCGGGPRAPLRDALAHRDVPAALSAYEALREVDGPDPELLAHVAALVLEQEARSDDPARRDAALLQLRLAGNAGVPILRRLADANDDPRLRARALEALARRGDRDARAYLYALLDSDDPVVLAAAIGAIDADEDTPRLLRLVVDPDPSVRRAAALALADAEANLEAFEALAQTARVDPEPRVRAAAARALGAFGAAAVPVLRERLGDADPRVRLAVVRALLRADRATAVEVLAPLLATPPSRAGVEAARLIALGTRAESTAQAVDERARDARLYLLGALGDDDPNLRAQAAVALVSLPRHETTDRAVRAALARESEPAVALQLARALLGRDPDDAQATEALRALLEGDGMPAIQAAILLARRGEDHALDRLDRALREAAPWLRRVAVRAMAHDAGRPDDVRHLLRDEDPQVRIHAAGGILAAANR